MKHKLDKYEGLVVPSKKIATIISATEHPCEQTLLELPLDTTKADGEEIQWKKSEDIVEGENVNERLDNKLQTAIACNPLCGALYQHSIFDFKLPNIIINEKYKTQGLALQCRTSGIELEKSLTHIVNLINVNRAY